MHIKKFLMIFLLSAIVISGQNSDSTDTDISSFFINSDQLNQLPIRGMKNILSLSPGIVLHNDKLYARGSRDDEIQYFIDGVPITDVMNGGYLIELPQEAFEKIEIQTGGVSVRYGNANSGYVFQKLKTGTNEFKFNIKYLSDNVTFKNSNNAFDGDKRLGAYWYGHNEILGEASGPIIKDQITFYALAHYKYERDQNPQTFPGTETDWMQGSYFDDYISVRLSLPAGAQPANSKETINLLGNISYDDDNYKFSINGIYNHTNRFVPDGNNVLNSLNYFRTPKMSFDYYLASLNLIHKLFTNTSYNMTLSYSHYNVKQFDPLLKADYFNYYNKEANEQVGVYNFISAYSDPGTTGVNGFSIKLPGYINSDYIKHNQTSFYARLDFTTTLSDKHELKYGSVFEQYFIKHFRISKNTLTDYVSYLLWEGEIPPESRLQFGYDSPDTYGYDVYGNELITDDIHGPRNPLYAGIYLEDNFKSENISITTGIRGDYFYTDNYQFDFSPDYYFDYIHMTNLESWFSKTKGLFYISPRINLSYQINEDFILHSNFGKYVQQTKFTNLYQGMYNYLSSIQTDFFRTTGIGFNLKPITSYLTEIGLKYFLRKDISIKLKGYYKITSNLPILENYWYNISILSNLENKGETKIKGCELSFKYDN